MSDARILRRLAAEKEADARDARSVAGMMTVKETKGKIDPDRLRQIRARDYGRARRAERVAQVLRRAAEVLG